MVEQIQLIMKAQILKIAGVKSEKEFYKKYPSEEAFMKVHGKAFKKAQMGTLVGGATPKQNIFKPISFTNFREIYDDYDKIITGSTQEERDKKAYEEAMLAAAAKDSGGGGGGMGDMMGNITGIMKMFGNSGGGAQRYGGDIPRAYSGFVTPNWFTNATTTAQSTYPPNITQSPYGIGAQTLPASTPSNRLPGTQGSYPGGGVQQGPPNTSDPNWMYKKTNTIPQVGAPSTSLPGSDTGDGGPSGFTKAVKSLDILGGPAVGIAEGYDKLRAERRERKRAEQAREVSKVALRASMTREEESKRRYVRPEDIQNTGEEFFPIYGVGTNVLTRNGGAIRRAQNGSYIGGNPTEIQNTYSNGYDIYTDSGYEPLINPNELKDFRHGGHLYRAQSGWSNWMNSMNGGGSGFSGAASAGSSGGGVGSMVGGSGGSGGGTPWGQIGTMATGAGQSAMGGQNAGGQIGGTVGKSVGSIFGPIGGAIGEFAGGMIGNVLDTNPKKIKKAYAQAKANTTAIALSSAFQGLQQSNNRYVRNGGDIPTYEDGGYMNPEYNPQLITMFGDHTAEDFADYANKYRAGGHLKSYTEPSERAMETYAMGGQLKTHWGGKAETISHNPYMPGSGETVLFRGQSHNESDREGNTGIGITYGESPVEVERGEPMFEMQAGGEINPQTGETENTGVVFGNMPIDKKIVAQFDDPDLMEIANKYHGKKFKNVGIELAKQEAKQNKIIDKNTKMLDSFKVETSLDKAKFTAIQANMEGADAKLRNIANTKITLANYQNAINDAKEELSDVIGENLSAEDLARGYAKLDKDPVTMDAKWGGNIAKKAKAGITTTNQTTTVPPKTFKSKREAEAAGYYKDAKGNWTRTINKYSTKTDETKAADALGYVPKGQKQSASGLWGKVTPEAFEAAKNANAWYPGWKDFDPKDKNDVMNYQMAFNARAKALGSSANINVDGDFGDQTVTARIDESKKTTPAETEEVLTATVDEPTTPATPEEKAKFPWLALANQAINYLRPSDVEELDMAQLYPEMYAMSSNQLEPVPAQSYQPELIVPYDISLQAQRNAVISGQRALEKQLGYNPAAQANVAPAAYNAINEINEKEFIANQGLKNQVYTGNINTMNEAKKINLGIFADQWAKQSLARSNTKATTQAALNSIADKYAKNRLENRKLSIYENMYNYRFGKSGRAQNYNPLQIFDTSVGGSGSSDKSGGLAEGKEFTYDKYGNIVGVKSADKNSVSDADLESAGGISLKNGGYTKIKTKNGSILRDFKNL
jgi:hypothetical protein